VRARHGADAVLERSERFGWRHAIAVGYVHHGEHAREQVFHAVIKFQDECALMILGGRERCHVDKGDDGAV
jgi:hypothetical protein